MEHESFYIDHAVTYGLDAAVVLHRVYRWVKHNKGAKRNMVNGVYWTRLSSKQAREYLPFMSEQKIARLMRELVAAGALIADELNKRNTDRTKWYTVPDGVIPGFSAKASHGERECLEGWGGSDDEERDVQRRIIECSRMNDQECSDLNPLLDKEKHKNQTEELDQKEERQSASASLKEKGRPVTSTGNEAFDAFWQAYPRKVAKAAAKSAYARKATTPEMEARILRAVNERIGLRATDPRFIPHPASWLRAERWDDEEANTPPPTSARAPSRAPMSSADAQRMIDTGDLNGFELA